MELSHNKPLFEDSFVNMTRSEKAKSTIIKYISKEYIIFYSCDPKHTKSNLSFSKATKLQTIVAYPDIQNKRILQIKWAFMESKYSYTLMQTGTKSAKPKVWMNYKTAKRV